MGIFVYKLSKEREMMANAVHVISEPKERSQPKNSWPDDSRKIFCSGYWHISTKKAETLVGGWLYFHATKANPSYYGGRILGFRSEIREEYKRKNRVVFDFMPSKDAKGHPWRGQAHGNAWTGTIVEANLPHEKESADA